MYIKMNSLNHIAFIADGNMRWAKQHNLSAVGGYEAGLSAVEKVIIHAQGLNIPYLTFYLLSLENIKRRSAPWKKNFFGFALRALRTLRDKPLFEKTQLRVIGDLSQLPENVREELARCCVEKPNSVMTVVIAIAYTGKDEMVRAMQKWQADPERQAPLTEEGFEKYLDTYGIPDPDLLIRSGDAWRLSGFLLWQLAYTELRFVPDLWPDFTSAHLDAIIQSFHKSERNYGQERKSLNVT